MWMDVLLMLGVWAVPAVLLLLMRRETSRNRTAKDAGDGKLIFELDQITYWAWLALFVYLLYTVVIQFGGGHFQMSSVWVALVLLALAVGLMMPFPETITAGPEGLVQEIRFWLKKKNVAWGDVREIRTAKKNKLLIVEGVDGTKIVHTRQLPDRERLLEELYRNCGDKVPAELRPVMALVQEMAVGPAVENVDADGMERDGVVDPAVVKDAALDSE
ncbi:MAG: hypothetical protein ACP5M4_05105 [Acidobacteriaceae bacterium]